MIAANNESSYIFFLYKEGGIQWTTGDNNGGTQGIIVFVEAQFGHAAIVHYHYRVY